MARHLRPPRALTLTGTLADGWVPSLGRVGLEQASAMRATVRAAAEAAGRSPDEITCAINLIVEFTPNGPAASPEGQRIAGPSETIAERLIAIAHAGFTVLNVALADADARRRFAAEVMPLVRDGLTRPA